MVACLRFSRTTPKRLGSFREAAQPREQNPFLGPRRAARVLAVPHPLLLRFPFETYRENLLPLKVLAKQGLYGTSAGEHLAF